MLCFSFEFSEHGVVVVSSSSTIPLRILSPFLTFSSEIPFNFILIPFCFSATGLPFAESENFKEIISSISC
jgi:hypothetical protein